MQLNARLIYSLLISIFIFLVIFEGICYISYSKNIINQTENKIVNTKPEPELETDDILNYKKHHDFISRMKYGEKKSTPNTTIIVQEESYPLFQKIKDSDIIINIIYILLVFCLLQQINLFFLSIKEKNLPKIYIDQSTWSTNTAPMLGILGTFYSIAILLNTNSGISLSEALIQNFFDATMTTIIGIIFYIINSYLDIYIYSSISNKNG